MNSAWFFCSHLPRADCFCNAEPACKGQNELLPNIPLSLTVTKTQSYMLWRKKQIHEAGRPENRNQPCTKRWAAGTWTKLMRPIYIIVASPGWEAGPASQFPRRPWFLEPAGLGANGDIKRQMTLERGSQKGMLKALVLDSRDLTFPGLLSFSALLCSWGSCPHEGSPTSSGLGF